MAKARIKVHKTKTVKIVKVNKSRNKQKGNPNKCPVCGKFIGSKHG